MSTAVDELEYVMMESTSTAVIGPAEHVQQLTELAQRVPELRTTAFPYGNEREAGSLYKTAALDHAVAVFAGPKPFHIAMAEAGQLIPMVYVPVTGATLYRAIFLHGQNCQQDYRMSIDTVTAQDVEHVITDLGLPGASFKVLPYLPELQRDDLVRFHVEAFRTGEAVGALTTLQGAFDELKGLRVPVTRVQPARSSMITTLERAALLGRATEASKHELVVGVFEFDPADEDVTPVLDCINDFIQEVDGMPSSSAEGYASFFASRGLLEHVTLHFSRFSVLMAARAQGVRLRLGIGLGHTANQAHSHARAALAQARSHDGNVAFVVSSARKALGPIGDGKPAAYRVEVSDAVTLDLARQVGTGPVSIQRFLSALARWDQETFTAQDLANLLRRDVRTVRRLISKLREAGVVHKAGKAQLHGPGKPRLVFRLNPDHEALIRDHMESAAVPSEETPRASHDHQSDFAKQPKGRVPLKGPRK